MWCGLHSLLLSGFLRSRLERTLKLTAAQYRLAYSALSLITLYPVVAYSKVLGALSPLFGPPPWLWPQLLVWAAAAGLLLWSSWDFSRSGFDLMGLKAAFSQRRDKHQLITTGAYAHMRHPMHLAALAVVWVRPLRGPADLLISGLLTAYIALGTWHEEARLRRQFGQEYREYARRVSLVPFLRRRLFS
jgi:protein-S-isoprenylcysteine O-methyltransferase Ste14